MWAPCEAKQLSYLYSSSVQMFICMAGVTAATAAGILQICLRRMVGNGRI